MGRIARGPRPKSSHILPSSIEQMWPVFAHRQCDEPLWRHLVRQTISAESLHQLLYIWRCQSSTIRVDVVCRSGGSSLLLSQQLELLSTLFSQQLCLLRPLLVKEGYLFPTIVKFILNELGFECVLSVWTQSGQHCA